MAARIARMKEMDEHQVSIFIKISEQLGTLNGNMSSVLSQLEQHNLRISRLESSEDQPFYRQMLVLLGKVLVIGAGVIATMCGGGSLVRQTFGLGI